MQGISIIVLTYNCEAKVYSHLAELTRRVQPYDNIQIIVKDGFSIDETIKHIEGFSKQVTFVSQRDAGIYAALNQATEKATREFIAICHVGDMLNVDNVMELYKNTNGFSGYDIICGAAVVKFVNHERLRKANRDLNALEHTMSLFHPSTIIRKQTLKELNGYNENFRISGDYDFFVRAKSLKKRFMICDVKLSEIEYGGFSTQLSSIMTLTKEYSLILGKKRFEKLFFVTKFILLNTLSIVKNNVREYFQKN